MEAMLVEQREDRIERLKAVEELLGARVIVYFSADSPVTGAKIHEDALRPLYSHLRDIGKQEHLALFLYSRGGQLEAPWKIVSLLRRFADTLSVVVPYRAHSAATMIAIGADKIVMSDLAELGPIDPSLEVQPGGAQKPMLGDLGVEDVASYLKFIKERAGISNQQSLSLMLKALTDDLTPPLVGRLERVASHIRLVARQLLSLHRPQLKNRRVSLIAKTLIEDIYVHGHGIGREQAKELGLDIQSAEGALNDAIYGLYESYEEPFRLRESRELDGYFGNNDLYQMDGVAAACLESAERLTAFVGNLRARRIRRFPAQPKIDVNLQLQLPPNITPTQLPQGVQQAVQQILQQGIGQLQQAVQQQLMQQGLVEGYSAGLEGGRWKVLDPS